MDVNPGDKVAVDANRVGKPRRTGVVQEVTEGISGTRVRVAWDDGTESTFKPSVGSLVIERRARSSKKKPAPKDAAAKKTPAKKAAAKKTAAKKAKSSTGKKKAAGGKKKSTAKKR